MRARTVTADRLRRRPRGARRGFALLVVVLISGLASITALALLDVVDVDLGVAREHSANIRVTSLVGEAVREVMGDNQAAALLPDFQSSELEVRYAGRDANGALVKGPGSASPRTLSAANSVVVRDVGLPTEESYEAVASLVGFGPVENTGLTSMQAVHYEVAVTAESGAGRYTREHRVGVTRLMASPGGVLLTPTHAR
jgi:hypothetical protein